MQSTSSKINTSSSRRMGKLTGVLPCFNGTREVKEIKENHTNKMPEKNASVRRFRSPAELRILDSATRWDHLRPLTTELIRRLFPNSQFEKCFICPLIRNKFHFVFDIFPKCFVLLIDANKQQFIVVNQAHKYGQLQAMKLLNLFRINRIDELTKTPCEQKQRNVKNLSCASSRRCKKTFRLQPNELNRNSSTDEASTLPNFSILMALLLNRSCCLVLKAEEIQDKDLRDIFFLELLPEDQSKFGK
ncbi:hypothetical protein PHET_00634 [Paragonimus heterotremus]|uniref:Uncharacterized protein n=1 Tax=Paragonimus heterotremus TaxID=100268 RepID=A0A8J4T6Q2_9TREM|nr:hypothetical protein PHET_00634 [Paragonimus heterotremus]